ncbi:hypothetical protein [Tenacibaculum maritimum]|uniref:hypothetical protein n=1 Tax=Tenacibaculum maritimum TaxID=107401 RepID=UPI003876AD59
MKKEAIIDSLKRSAALTFGAAGSRVVADKLPIKNLHLKRGGFVLVSALGAALVGRETTSKAVVQDIALGTVATQAGLWIKEAVGEKVKENSLLKTALGSPTGTYDNPVQFRMGYANLPTNEVTIDAAHEEVSGVQFAI